MSAPALGALRRRFVVEAPFVGDDGMLGWRARFSAWGALSLTPEAAHVRLRSRASLQPGWRLRLGARLFEIVKTLDDAHASDSVTCICREVSA